jgi:DNA repair protein RadC
MDALYAHYVAFLHINIEDIRTTEQVRRAGEALEIELLDHIILGQQRYVSLKERGLGF